MRQNFIKTESLGPRKTWILWTFFVSVLDKVCPTFILFLWHEQKLTKFNWNLTVFPSHFNNIYLKSFGLLQNLTINYEKLWDFMKDYKCLWYYMKLIKFSQSQYFAFIQLQCTLLTFALISKVDCKILVLFGLIQNYKVSNLTMAKAKKSISQILTPSSITLGSLLRKWIHHKNGFDQFPLWQSRIPPLIFNCW